MFPLMLCRAQKGSSCEAALLAALALVLAECRIGFAQETPPRYQTNVVEGWTVVLNERLLANEKAATEKALEILRGQLREIVRVAPAPAVVKLREVTLWFSPEYPGVKPKAEYHPGAGWLRDHGRDPAMVEGIEFTDVRNFESEARRMPNFTLHELAHAYHHRVLPDGFDNKEIKAAFERQGEQVIRAGRAVVRQRQAEHLRTLLRHDEPAGIFRRIDGSVFRAQRFFPFHARRIETARPSDGRVAWQTLGRDAIKPLIPLSQEPERRPRLASPAEMDRPSAKPEIAS